MTLAFCPRLPLPLSRVDDLSWAPLCHRRTLTTTASNDLLRCARCDGRMLGGGLCCVSLLTATPLCVAHFPPSSRHISTEPFTGGRFPGHPSVCHLWPGATQFRVQPRAAFSQNDDLSHSGPIRVEPFSSCDLCLAQIYCDDLDQLERAREQEASSGDGQPEASVGRCTESVVLDSATQRILSLEDELRKVEADREHWQVLAKQVSAGMTCSCWVCLSIDQGECAESASGFHLPRCAGWLSPEGSVSMELYRCTHCNRRRHRQ